VILIGEMINELNNDEYDEISKGKYWTIIITLIVQVIIRAGDIFLMVQFSLAVNGNMVEKLQTLIKPYIGLWAFDFFVDFIQSIAHGNWGELI
jgi:hypothetical protein